MRRILIALAGVACVAFSGQAMADHIGAGEHTRCANKTYRAKHKKTCAHWGAHYHRGIHLEGSH
jgi:hypothetical protein